MASRSDTKGLEKLCNIPDGVKSISWETFSQGNDWGLVAVFTIADSTEFGMETWVETNSQVFVGFDPLPDWISSESGVVFTPIQASGVYVVNTRAYEPSVFAKSPLPNGFVLRPSESVVVLGLHTR